MRIRRAATKVLGSTYFTTQGAASHASARNSSPELAMLGPTMPGGGGGLGSPVFTLEGACSLSQSPWDLAYELNDPNPLEDPFDKYMVHIPHRESFTCNSDNDDKMEVDDKIWKQKYGEDEEAKDQKAAHKEKQGGEIREMNDKMNGEHIVQEADDMVVEEMENNEKSHASVWYCNKNDGKRWHCRNIVDGPKTLCDYHLAKSRSYYTPTSETGATATSKSSRIKASAIARSTMPKSSSKPTPTATSSSLRAASSRAQNNSKEAASSVSVLASSQPHKRKACNGLGDDDFYFYSLFGPFRGKDRGDSSKSRVAIIDAEEKGFLLQDKTVHTEEKDNKKEYIDVDNLSYNSSISSSNGESDEDYVVGATKKPCAKKGKGNIAVGKVRFSKMPKKHIKERSLKSLL